MSPFKVGDVVRHRDRDVPMTVERSGQGWVLCVWFENGRLSTDTFSPEMLVLGTPIVLREAPRYSADALVEHVRLGERGVAEQAAAVLNAGDIFTTADGLTFVVGEQGLADTAAADAAEILQMALSRMADDALSQISGAGATRDDIEWGHRWVCDRDRLSGVRVERIGMTEAMAEHGGVLTIEPGEGRTSQWFPVPASATAPAISQNAVARIAELEAENAELRILAQKTADQECIYLREITDLHTEVANRLTAPEVHALLAAKDCQIDARDARIAELDTELAKRPRPDENFTVGLLPGHPLYGKQPPNPFRDFPADRRKMGPA